MRLSVYLSWVFLENVPVQRFLFKLFTSRVSGMFMGLNSVFMIITALQNSSTLQTVLLPVSNVFDCYSAFTCLSVSRQARFWSILRKILRLVNVMEATLGEKVWMDNTKRIIGMFCATTLSYAIFVFSSLWTELFLSGTSLYISWPFEPYLGSWGEHVGQVYYNFVHLSLVCLCVVWMYTAVGCATCTSAGLHHALAQYLISNVTPRTTENAVKMHQQLRLVTLDMVDFFAGNLAKIMAHSFCNAVIATIQVLANEVSSGTFVNLIAVSLLFTSLCFFSQMLSDASLALQTCAYRAATSGVQLPEAHALALVMLAAGRPPALRCRGLGRLNLAAAGDAFRRLYSVISVLGTKY
ncbi:Odorant receptor 17 [Frankliniella occidentalis]|uniref:Uncharacterized protein LOC127750580 n=1 Tax=Frankliniella occidentalis TaxID=133901 RepID=A0A9C6X3P8_FRAOC|nr:uncharacterized protein LOC127750580 [Frankliniella occidentalis]KAE8741334.1 Odorant receptor 17 [Frankliniella occidentalis]